MGGIVTYVLELKRPSPPEPARTGSAVLQRRLASAAVGCPAGVHIVGSKSTRCALSGRAVMRAVAASRCRRAAGVRPGHPAAGPSGPRGLRSDVEEAQPPRASAYATYPRPRARPPRRRRTVCT